MFVCYMEGNVEDAHVFAEARHKKESKKKRNPGAPCSRRGAAGGPAPRLTTPGFNDFI